MKNRSLLSWLNVRAACVIAIGILFAAPLYADKTGVAPSPSLDPSAKWWVFCDSQHGCKYWSDKKGNGKYPSQLINDSIEVRGTAPDETTECTWVWRYYGGSWHHDCILASDEAKKHETESRK